MRRQGRIESKPISDTAFHRVFFFFFFMTLHSKDAQAGAKKTGLDCVELLQIVARFCSWESRVDLYQTGPFLLKK